MLISHKHKFITIDIPKTGTRSLRETFTLLNIIDVIGEPLVDSKFYQHGSAIQAKKQFDQNNWNWNNYFKFTIVRNPWNRYLSFFKYLKGYFHKFENQDASIEWTPPAIHQGKYCKNLFSNSDEHLVFKKIILNYNSQDSYYCNESSDIIVDHIAEFENLSYEFSFLCDQVKIQSTSLQHSNKSKNTLNVRDLYNQELIDLVAQKEKHVINLKGYTI